MKYDVLTSTYTERIETFINEDLSFQRRYHKTVI